MVLDQDATTAVVTGTLYRDANTNGTRDAGESALADRSVYLDADGNGSYTSGELTGKSDAGGVYFISGVPVGTAGVIRQFGLSDYIVPAAPTFAVTGPTVTTVDVGFFPFRFYDSALASQWTLRGDPAAPGRFQILVNGALSYSAPLTVTSSLTFNFSGVGQRVTIDYQYGMPLTSNSLTVAAASATNGLKLVALATDGDDTVSLSTSGLAVNGRTVRLTNVSEATIDPRGGLDSVNAATGTLRIPALPPGGVRVRRFSKLAYGQAKLVLEPAADIADRAVLVIDERGFSPNYLGQLDVGNHTLIVRNLGYLDTVYSTLQSGYAKGAWTGAGIMSSLAASDGQRRHTVSSAINLGALPAVDGVALNQFDVVIKYTLYGDTDLNGKVDFNDFLNLQAKFGRTGTRSATEGNFNYDYYTNFDDFLMLQANFGLTA